MARSTWLEPSANAIVARGSGGLRRIEFGDPVYEPLRVLRVEIVPRAVDDLLHTTIAGDGLSVFAALLVDIAEELPSVRDIRIAVDEMAGGGLGLFQLAFLDEAKGGVDRLVQVVPIVRGTGEAGHDRVAGLALLQAPGCGARLALSLLGGEPLLLGRLVPRQAARLVFLAASARAAIVASGLGHRGRALPSEDASLYATLLADAKFHDLLLAVDRDLAEACRTDGCACGGRRHVARYARKPRGRPCRLGPEHDQRFSFCCAVDGCRSRATPPSLRFLGRRVYVATIVVLITILQHGVSDARLERLSEVVSVDRRTIARWRRWWRDTFTATPFWRVARAAFMPPLDGAQLPAALIDRFGGDAQDRLVALLRFLGPVTGGARMRAF